jgi:hypothetical protein
MVHDFQKDRFKGIKNKHERRDEKLKKILLWLVEYHYSTNKILCDFLGVNHRGQGAFFKRLVDENILYSTRIFTINGYVYSLTDDGRSLAERYLARDIDYKTNINRISPTTVYHNLACQKAVLARLREGVVHTFEKHLDFTSKDKLPDVLIEDGGIKTALEIELTRKNNDRVFRAFMDHVNAIKQEYYHVVEYIFPNGVLRDNYQAKFDLAEWPIIEKKGSFYRRTDKVFEPDSIGNLRERFKFSVQNFDE